MKILTFFILLSFQTLYGYTPEEALSRLKAGNQRYVHNQLEHPNRDAESRQETKTSQTPYGTILGCSDSRVPPEILFDEGIGDLFVVRVAGNIASAVEIDSIDYSAIYLGSSIILVLGHENCGAVQAVLDNNTKDIQAVANLIAGSLNVEEKNLEAAIKQNVKGVVKKLKISPVIARLISEHKLNVVGGYYHFKTGEVEFLE